MALKTGDKVIGYYYIWKPGEDHRTLISYHGTLVHIAEEGVYVVEQADGTEVLVELAEDDVIELDEKKEQRQ